MTASYRSWIAPALGVWVLASAAYACSDADRNTQKPTGQNGCVGDSCYTDASTSGEGGGPGGSDGGGDGAAGFADPLQGTSKTATLVKDGFQFTEGPVWVGGRLLFSDVNANTIFELKPDDSTAAFRTNTGGANGLAVDAAGKLYACESGRHRVTKSDATMGAATTTIASQFSGAPLNSPNDVIVKKDGTVYFTDPDYAASPDAAARQPKQGVYRIAPGGGVSSIAQYDSNPNGIALSPDETILYVDDSDANVVRKFAVAADGKVDGASEAKFVDTSSTPDGMAVDDAGNLYVATTAGVEVYDPSGKKLGTIAIDGGKTPSNCTFGGPDRRTLYVTAEDGLYSIVLNVPGLP